MTKLYDESKIIEIELFILDKDRMNFSPDFSADFFDVGQLEYNEDMEAFRVQDVNYCVEQAMDWKNSEGDFSDDADYQNPNEEKMVVIQTI